LFFNINSIVDPENHAVKIVKEEVTTENVASLIKTNYFDGSIEVLCFGIQNNDVLKTMIIDTIIIIPKIIMCSPLNNEFLKNRYTMIDDEIGVFLRNDVKPSV
jgi:hypothetical protein